MENKKRRLKNQKGMATIEAVCLMIVFVVLISYSLGFFGVVHTGIKNSIAARSFAFETFRNRSNLFYWRDDRKPQDNAYYPNNFGYRYHSITSERSDSSTEFVATDRHVAFARIPEEKHEGAFNQLRPDPERDIANPVWVRSTYGICLNARCGD